eukprot:Em0012g6a
MPLTSTLPLHEMGNLCREDESVEINEQDLRPGAGVLCEIKGKTYPVEVIAFQDGGDHALVETGQEPVKDKSKMMHDSGGGDDSTRQWQEPVKDKSKMMHDSDDGDDSTRRRQEPVKDKSKMMYDSDDDDDRTRRRQEPVNKQLKRVGSIATSSESTGRKLKENTEQRKRILLGALHEPATVSTEWATIALLRSINNKLSEIVEEMPLPRSKAQEPRFLPMQRETFYEEDDWYNGVNLTLIPKRIYIWLVASRHIFSKRELKESLLFPSLKSCKPSLCPEKVQRIIATIKRQFPTEHFDLSVFTQKANQKCRDTTHNYPEGKPEVP